MFVNDCIFKSIATKFNMMNPTITSVQIKQLKSWSKLVTAEKSSDNFVIYGS